MFLGSTLVALSPMLLSAFRKLTLANAINSLIYDWYF